MPQGITSRAIEPGAPRLLAVLDYGSRSRDAAGHAASDGRAGDSGQSEHARLETSGTKLAFGDRCTLGIVGNPRWCAKDQATINDPKAAAEALASAYLEQGSDCLQHLHGHFALLICDPVAGRIIAATDRIGSFPIYHARSSGCVAASVSLDDLSEVSTRGGQIDAQGIYHYVYFHMIPSERTILDGHNKLQLASVAELSADATRVKRYHLPQITARSGTDSPASHQELRDTLQTVVGNNLPDNTSPVGAFLSGGLDSSSVVGMLAQCTRDRRAEAFAIGFDAEGYDEMPYARITAEHFGVKLNEYYVSPEDIVDALPVIAASTDEPFGNSSILPAYFCARMAANTDIHCLLAGDGGDELFAGNTRYQKQLVFERYRRAPGILRHGLLEPLVRLAPGALPLANKAKSFVAQANTDLPARLHTYNFLHREAADEVFDPSFLARVDLSLPSRQQAAVFNAIDGTALNQMLYLDWQYTLADNDLRKVRQACGLAGVDVRFPLIDDELVALSLRLDDDAMLAGGELRGFFKAALKGWLPDATISKSKHGFGLPFGVWMTTHKPLRDIAHGAIADLEKRQLFRPAFLHRALEAHGTVHAAYYGELIWILTVLELWLQAHS